MDQRLLFDGLQDGKERIADRQDEAGGELLKWSPGVHERRRVGEEFQPRHGFIKSSRRLPESARCRVESFCFRDVYGDTPEQLGRSFNDAALLVFPEIAATQDH